MGVQATTPEQMRQRLFNPQQNPLYPNPAPPPPGAPPDFPGAVLPNPDNRQPQLDTAPPPPTKLSDGASFSHPNASGPPPMDTSNPPMNQMAQPAMREVGTEPQRGSIAQGMQQQQTSAPPANAPIAQAPQPFHHGKLASIMLGIGEALGNPLATHIGERDRQREQEVDEYQRNLPATQYTANVGAQKTAAELQREAAQTDEARQSIETSKYNMGKEQETAKANAISQIQTEVEGGHFGDGAALLARWRRIAQANPHIGLTDEDINGAIHSTHPLGAKYSVMKGEGGRPEGLQDREGNVYTPDKIPADPEAQALWTNAGSGHQQARTEKRDDEAYVAGKAAESQARTFNNQQTESGRKEASKHLGDLRGAQNQLDLVNKLASSKSPTDQTSLAFKALGLDLPDGVHRINETELNAIRNQGSLSDRAYRTLLNWKAGEQFAPDILEDIKNTASTIASSKMKTANDNLEDVSRVYGYKAPGSDVRGRFDKGQQAGVPDTSQSANQNNGDVLYARDPQGKLHKAAKGTALPQGWKAENAPATK